MGGTIKTASLCFSKKFLTYTVLFYSIAEEQNWHTCDWQTLSDRSDRYGIFRKKFSSQEKIWLDMTSSFTIRILILAREVGYLF